MAMPSLGLILPNRAVVLGKVTVRDLLDLTVEGERAQVFDTIWVGDSLLAKPRLESVTLLSALAAVTSRVRLGVGCMATFVHRHPVMLAHQWASLDVLSGGRAWLAVCLGGPDSANAAQALEHAAMGVASGERIERLEEGIAVLRALFHAEGIAPRPVLLLRGRDAGAAAGAAALPDLDRVESHRAHLERRRQRLRRRGRARATPGGALRRRLDDQQALARRVSPAVGAHRGDGARGGARSGADGQRALSQHQHPRGPPGRARGIQVFLDAYYSSKFSPAFVEGWTVAGSPKQCADQLAAYFEAGVSHMALRLTSWDQRGQLARLLDEVAPALAGSGGRRGG